MFRWLKRPTILLGVGFATLAAILATTFLVTGREEIDQAWVRRTLEVQNRLAATQVHLARTEMAQRTYLLTGQPFVLAQEASERVAFERELDGLGRATQDDPVQQQALVRLRRIVVARLHRLDAGIAIRSRGVAIAVNWVSEGRGAALSRNIVGALGTMGEEEARLLQERQTRVQTSTARLRWGIGAGFLVLLVLTAFGLLESANRMAALEIRRKDLEAANARLIEEAARREEAEERMRQMQKMEAIGHLTGGIAHDFNNMLAAIIGNLELARRRLRTQPERAEASIDNGIEAAQKASSLTNRLLAFSRQQPLSPVTIDANRLVAGMTDLLRRTLGESFSVETVLAGGLWRIHADAHQLENALLNLSVNGRDAMADGGKLTIETMNASLDEAYARTHPEVGAGQYVMVSVTDTGGGMTEEVIRRAFDPFFTTKMVGKGTGLGLSQVFGFVKQSGGHVKIYSEVGHGTSVKIYLPRWTGAEVVSGGAVEPQTPPAARADERVLLVEDDDAVRHVAAEALGELGYLVIQANSGEQALALMAMGQAFDLLMTDIVMPGMTGRVLADKALAKRPSLKVLYITGYSRNAVIHNGILDAGLAFLAKPFTNEQLAFKVRQVLDGDGANRFSVDF